jgi:hypothetical protein
VRRAAALALLLLAAPSASRADDADAAAAREAKVAAATRALDEDRRAFQARVDAAIDRGVAWLRTQQRSDGGFPAFGDHLPANTYDPMDWGVDALVLLTLAKSGLPPTDKAVERVRARAFADYQRIKGLKKVYVYPAATLILALEALYHPAATESTEVRRERYGTSVVRKKTPCRYPGPTAALVEELAKFLVGAQAKSVGGWRYPGNEIRSIEGVADVGNTQYALLGLNAAARCGTAVSVEVWLRAMEWLLKTQEQDGTGSELFVENPDWKPGLDDVPAFVSAGRRKARGWTYVPGAPVDEENFGTATGSMTCAGVVGLAIVKERLAEAGKLTPALARRIDAGLLDGLAWIGDVFTVTDNPVVPAASAMWHYYYLYGLERVGSLTGVRHHARQDWYRVGAEHLLGAQQKDGGWQEAKASGKPADSTESAITQTCFALLFLRRATEPPLVPVTPPVLTGGADEPPADGRAPR